MLKRLFALSLAVSVVLSTSLPAFADDETFVSLTRRATSVSKLPANISTISAKDIENSNAKSLDEIIDRVVGTQVGRSGSEGTFSTLRMRGVPSSSQVAIIIDDQPYGGFAADQNVDISQIPIENIDHIEVVRGGSSVLYGANTTGGVVHIFTKKKPAERIAAEVGYEGRSYQTDIERGEAGFDVGRFFGTANIAHMESDGYQGNSDVNSTNQYASVGTIVGSNILLGFDVSRTESDSGVAVGTSIPISEWDGKKERTPNNPTKRALRDRTEGRFHVDVPVGNAGQVQAIAFGSNDESESIKSIDTFNEPDFMQKAKIWGGDVRFLGASGFTGGVSYERDEQRSTYLELHHIANVAGYVQQEFNWQKLNVIPALRYDKNQNFGGFWSPRLSAVYHAAPIWAISGNVSRSYRAPSFTELFGDFPPQFTANRNLKPETAWTYDLGNQVKIGENSEIKLVGFYTDIKDRISGVNTDADTPNDTNDNIARSSLAGAEFEAKSRMGIAMAWGNYTYQRSKQPLAGKSDTVDVPLSPHHIANVGLDLDLPAKIVLTNNLRYVSKQYAEADRSSTLLPSYAVWNARVGMKIKFVEVFAGVNNILDRHYAESKEFEPFTFAPALDPMPTRNFYGGVNVRFAATQPES